MLAYLGGVVSVLSRAVPDTWDVLLEHSQAMLLSVTIITPFGHPDSAPPFSRRRGLSTTLNALPSTSAFFPCVLNFAFPTCVEPKLNILVECARCFPRRGNAPADLELLYPCCNSRTFDLPRDQLHGTSYNISINTHHKVCNHDAVSGLRKTIPQFTPLLRKDVLCVSSSVNRRQWT